MGQASENLLPGSFGVEQLHVLRTDKRSLNLDGQNNALITSIITGRIFY